MTTEKDLKNCPHCGMMPTLRTEIINELSNKHEHIYWFECQICGIVADTAKSITAAEKNWNDKIMNAKK